MTIVEELRIDRESGARRLESEYKAGLMTLARRFCADEGDAEELVNRTLAAVVEGIDDYLEQSAFFGWMCKILENIHAKDVRRKSSRTVAGDAEAVAGARDDEAEDRIFREVDASLLRDAIAELPADLKDALMLRYFMDLPVSRVARILAAPEGTVKWRLHCARMVLAAKLGAQSPGVRMLLLALLLAAGLAVGGGVYALATAAASRAESAEFAESGGGSREVEPSPVVHAESAESVNAAEGGLERARSALPTPAEPASNAAEGGLEPSTTETTTMNAKAILAATMLAAPAVVADTASSASGFAHDAIKNESPHGQLLIVSGTVDAVGDGTTTLSLWVGQSLAGMACVETRTIAAPGTQTFRYTSPRAFGDWDYWWVKMEQTVDGTTTETWFPSYATGDNWIHYRDGSFYEWTGGASGVWSDAANWTQTAEVDYGGAKTGYPAEERFGGGILPAGGTYDIAFTADVNPDELRIGDGVNLTLRGTNRAPRVAFDHVYRGENPSSTINYSGLSSFVVDGLDLWYTPEMKSTAASASYVVTNGGRWVVSGEIYPQGTGTVLRLAPGAALESGGFFCGGANGLVEIDDATVTMTGEGWYPAYRNGAGSRTVLKGAAPAIVCTSASAKVGGGAGADATLEFVVPAGGWALPPVRGAAGGAYTFGTAYWDAGDLVVNVATNSPAATAEGVTDAVLVSWPGGFNTDRIVYGTLPNPATDEFYIANNATSNVPELHVRVFGQASGEADPTITSAAATVRSRTEATFSAVVMLGGAASSATAALLLSANGGAESVATNAILRSSGSLVLPLSGLPAGAICRARLRVENSDGRVATSDAVEFRLLASYAEFEVAGEDVTLDYVGKDTIARFASDGAFTVLRGGEAEVLIVAGGGTGLGLPIVKRLLEACNGTIEMESAPGEGTRVHIHIARVPVLPKNELPAPDPASAGTDALKLPEGFRAVIVDDVPINLKILDLHVKGLGVTDIAPAASAEEALKAIAEKKPDIVLTDMWMPGMSGADLAAEIRKNHELDGVPLVAVTADNDVGATFDASLFAEILTKPVTAAKLKLAMMHLFPDAR